MGRRSGREGRSSGRTWAAALLCAACACTSVAAGVSAASGTASAAATGPAWTRASQSGPAGRAGAAMAYDPATKEVVVFGGAATTTAFGTTWVWNGSSWKVAAPTGPVLTGAVMAYDTQSHQLVLFGGEEGQAARSTTWVWSGTSWTKVATSGPSTTLGPHKRYRASMTYDPAMQRLVLFGGAATTFGIFGTTWTWNGSSWSEIATTAPGPSFTPSPQRTGGSLAYDTATGQLVLSGGTRFISSTWLWNAGASKWTPTTTFGAPTRVGQGMAYDQALKEVLIFGGFGSLGNGLTFRGTTWAWNGSTWQEIATTAGQAALVRWTTSMAYDTAAGQMVLFGGEWTTPGYPTTTWVFALPPAPSSSVFVRRIDGATADATAAAELSATFAGTCPGSPGDRPVVLATDRTYADALSSAYLAKDLDTGTLLTPTDALSAATAAALKAEGITHVYVVGGPLAVSTAVVAALGHTPAYSCGGTAPTGADLQVTRIAGTTATATAAAVAAFAGAGFVGSADLAGAYGGRGTFNTTTGSSSAAASPGYLRTAILASDAEFQDAEGGAVLSYAQDLPILLTTPTRLPVATADAIGFLHIRQVVLLGGSLAVATSVVTRLEAAGVSVLRVGAPDFTGTSVELARLETAPAGAHEGFGWDARTAGLAVARGNGFADGLAGADVAAHGLRRSGPVPLLLTESQTTPGADLLTYLRHVGAHGIDGKPLSYLLVLGGTDALTPILVRTLAAIS